MRVNKDALLAATSTALDRLEQQERDYAAATEIWRANQRAKWLKIKQPAWRALRDQLTASIKSGKPITERQFRAALGSNSGRYFNITDYTYSPGAEPPDPIVLPDGTRVPKPKLETETSQPGYGRPRRQQQPPTTGRAELKALKLFLEGSPEESFTLEALSRLGFKGPAGVFRAAVFE